MDVLSYEFGLNLAGLNLLAKVHRFLSLLFLLVFEGVFLLEISAGLLLVPIPCLHIKEGQVT